MNVKYVTKGKLVRINAKALEAKANAIDPDYLKNIPAHLRFPVDRALPFCERHGWVRCFVTVGTTLPPEDGDLRVLLLDVPEREYEKLPSVDA